MLGLTIVQTVICSLSLVATIAVSFAIYWLQKRHEGEIERIEQNRIQRELEEKAHTFLSENSEERDYLPLCYVASNLFRHEKHTRQIYTNFCRCHIDLQKEILRQAGFELAAPIDSVSVDHYIECLQTDIEKHKLGRNYLYDGAKYFHRAYERYRDSEWEDLNGVQPFEMIAPPGFYSMKKSNSLLDYIEEYFYFLYSEHRPEFYDPNPPPPLDYMWEVFHLGNEKELEVCRWIMEAVCDIAIIIHNREKGQQDHDQMITDASIDTFEDKYLDTILWLAYTYYQK